MFLSFRSKAPPGSSLPSFYKVDRSQECVHNARVVAGSILPAEPPIEIVTVLPKEGTWFPNSNSPEVIRDGGSDVRDLEERIRILLASSSHRARIPKNYAGPGRSGSNFGKIPRIHWNSRIEPSSKPIRSPIRDGSSVAI